MARRYQPVRLPGSITHGDPAIVEWSRDVQRSLQQLRDRKIVDSPRPNQRRDSCGFRPVARNDDTPGVGLIPGYVYFARNGRFFLAGDNRQAEGIFPGLGGIALDATPRPRIATGAGNFEFHLITQDRDHGNSEARIVSASLGGGPGSLRKDEHSVRLCTFTVAVSGSGKYSVSNVVQFVCDYWKHTIKYHQWYPLKTGDAEFTIIGGDVCAMLGTQPDFQGIYAACPNSAPLAITGTASVWLQIYIYWEQHSADVGVVFAGGTPPHSGTLRNYRIANATYVGYSLTAPTPGTGNVIHHHGVTGHAFFELCQVALESGQAQVTRQIHSDCIFVTDLTDSELAAP